MTNKDIVRHVSEGLYGQGDTRLVDRYFAEDYVTHDPDPGVGNDREGLRQSVEAIHAALSDIEATATHLVAEGDLVAVRWRVTGRHTGPFLGMPATGRQIDVNGIGIYRLREGQIVEEWHRTDTLAMMQQLGMLPEEMA